MNSYPKKFVRFAFFFALCFGIFGLLVYAVNLDQHFRLDIVLINSMLMAVLHTFLVPYLVAKKKQS